MSSYLFVGLETAMKPCIHTRLYAHAPDRLKIWNPTSPGQRGRITVDRFNLWRGKPFKELTQGLTKSGGRNHTGRTTVWHQGGGHKRLYRLVDFFRRDNAVSIVRRIEYDPNRSARIALIERQTGATGSKKDFSYMLAPEGLGVGDTVSSQQDAPIRPGMTLPLNSMPTGTVIHNVELLPGKGGQLCRAAGTSAQLIKVGDDGYALVRLPSGEVRNVLGTCKATVGVVGNTLHKNRQLGKAGISRHLNIRPTTRALATNPVDHPAGGKSKKMRKTPWGKPFMGIKTRDPNKPGTHLIQLTRHKARQLARS